MSASNSAFAALAITAAAVLSPHPIPAPRPVIVVSNIQMLRSPVNHESIKSNEVVEYDATVIYRELKRDYGISHAILCDWIGVKKRSVHNWLNAPEKSTKYGSQIEERLFSLVKLKSEMEPEHRVFLKKIAFSPIYGNPTFGQDILTGASSENLILWYEKLFSQFESYRKIASKNAKLS